MNLMEMSHQEILAFMQENNAAYVAQSFHNKAGEALGAVIYVIGREESTAIVNAAEAISNQWNDIEASDSYLDLKETDGSAPETRECVSCHKQLPAAEVKYGPDPFMSEIHDDDRPVWMCEPCREERFLDT